jgi:hypothetical protein
MHPSSNYTTVQSRMAISNLINLEEPPQQAQASSNSSKDQNSNLRKQYNTIPSIDFGAGSSNLPLPVVISLKNNFRQREILPALTHGRVKKKRSKKYLCLQCQNFFKSKSKLNKHINTVHEQIMPFMCPDSSCGALFEERDARNIHINTFHNKEIKILCNLCKRTFNTEHNRDTHQEACHKKYNALIA